MTGGMSGGTRASAAGMAIEPGYTFAGRPRRDRARRPARARRSSSPPAATRAGGVRRLQRAVHAAAPAPGAARGRHVPRLVRPRLTPAAGVLGGDARSSTKVPGVKGGIQALAGRLVKGSTGGPDAAARAPSGSLILARAYDAGGRELADRAARGPQRLRPDGATSSPGAPRRRSPAACRARAPSVPSTASGSTSWRPPRRPTGCSAAERPLRPAQRRRRRGTPPSGACRAGRGAWPRCRPRPPRPRRSRPCSLSRRSATSRSSGRIASSTSISAKLLAHLQVALALGEADDVVLAAVQPQLGRLEHRRAAACGWRARRSTRPSVRVETISTSSLKTSPSGVRTSTRNFVRATCSPSP